MIGTYKILSKISALCSAEAPIASGILYFNRVCIGFVDFALGIGWGGDLLAVFMESKSEYLKSTLS